MKDLCITDTGIFASDECDLILQQIEILFDTKREDVFGEKYGTRFSDFLWDMQVSANEISEYTKMVIQNNVQLFNWSVSVETNIMQGTQNDIILITITLSNNFGDEREKTFRLQ